MEITAISCATGKYCAVEVPCDATVSDLRTAIARALFQGEGTAASITLSHADTGAPLGADATPLAETAVDSGTRIEAVQAAYPLLSGSSYSAYATSMAITPDGRIAFGEGTHHTISLWDGVSHALLWRTQALPDSATSDRILSICFSPDGLRVLAARSQRHALLLNATTGDTTGELPHARANRVRFTPGGTAVTACREMCRLWDAESAQLLHTIGFGSRSPVNDIALSVGSLITACDDSTVCMWDSTTGDCSAVLLGHTAEVNRVVADPDGSLAVSGGADTDLRVWSLAEKACLHVLHGCPSIIRSISVAWDTGMVACRGFVGCTPVWAIGRGCRPIYRETDHSFAGSVLLSPCGRYLLSAASLCVQVSVLPPSLDP